MARLDRREFLRRSALAIGALTGVGALAELVRLAGEPTAVDLGAALRRAVAEAPTTPAPTAAPAATVEPAAPPIPAVLPGPPVGEAVRWPEPTPGVEPPPGFALRVPVLMYHRVVDPALAGDSMPGLVVPPALFAAQLELLHAAGWQSYTAARLAQDLQLGREVPPRTFVITIDDGWLDGLTYALPVIQRFGYDATYFVIGDRIGRPGFLGPAELQALVAGGMEIGDHTFDHRAMPRLPEALQRIEIAAASARIAEAVGQAPVTFAYPDGRFAASIETTLAQQGFGLAVTTRPGTGASWGTRFLVPRVRVTPSSSPIGLLAQLEVAQLGL